jgi:hypothetical protein
MKQSVNPNDPNVLALTLALQNLQKQYGIQEKESCECPLILAIFCYIGEFLFYPPIVLVIYILYAVFTFVVLIVMGAILTTFIAFFPFYIMCCFCGDGGKSTAKMLCALGAIGLAMVFGAVFGIVALPFAAIFHFFHTYWKIFAGDISPYFTFKTNWNTMFMFIGQQNQMLINMKDRAKSM